MTKLCVKKPYTVLVAIVLVLVLGFVSLTGMVISLLPTISLPYLMVITTYPGASPERVESSVVQPIENALGTITGVKNVTSTCSENYGLVVLEFEEETNMDSATVKVSTALNSVSLPEMCSTPSLMEISMDMVATMYVGLSYDGMDIYELSDFANEKVIPYLERQDGVANVNGIGLVERSVQVVLKQDKIDDVNDRVLMSVSDTLDDAKKEMEKAQSELDNASAELESTQQTTGSSLAQASSAFTQLQAHQATLIDQQAQLAAQKTAKQTVLDQFASSGVPYDEVDSTVAQMQSGAAQLTSSAQQLNEAYPALQMFGDSTTLAELAAMAVDNPMLAPFVEMIPSLQAAGVNTIGDIPVVAASLEAQANELTAGASALSEAKAAVAPTLAQIDNNITNLEMQIQVTQAIIDQYTAAMGGASYEQVESGKIQAIIGFSVGQVQLQNAQTQLDQAKETYESSREEALKKANLNELLKIDTLSKMIYAQNFEMPAGYIDDEEDNQWLLKIGDEFENLKDIGDMLLFSSEALGEVYLKDVADVIIIDNTQNSYARVNGSPAVVLSIFQSSTAGTSEVSKVSNEALAHLEEQYPGFHASIMMDQGDYIEIIINSIVKNLLWGALLAVIVLALFLKDPKPTLVVAFSIPFSVMFAIVLMYFTNITMNMISLSGLALGIGMLVDNSVVVIENIYRLRARGLSPARAAVQGAAQVATAILSSTLTTICVFAPLLFSDGLTRELMTDMGLTIAYSLLASLLVALTVVPTMSVTLLRKSTPKSHKLFDKMLNGYEKLLVFCLKFKVVPIALATGLLVFSVYTVLNMGIVMMPDTGSNQVAVSLSLPEENEYTYEEATAIADDTMNAALQVEGVDTVGVMNSSATASIFTGMSSRSGDIRNFSFFLMLEEDADTNKVVADLTEATKDIEGEVDIQTSGSMDMSSMLSSGLQIQLYGNDLDDLMTASKEIMDIIGTVEGFTDISNGQEDGDSVAHLKIDKDEAMKNGLTVAQIFAELSGALTTEASSTTITLDKEDINVTVFNDTNIPTLESLLAYPFDVTVTESDGTSSSKEVLLKDFASLEFSEGLASIRRVNQTRTMTVSAVTEEGYNTTLLSRQVNELLEDYTPPAGVTVNLGGEYDTVNDMVIQMSKMIALAILFIYLIMVAQFQGLLAPFIVVFTIPLAFTGGLLGLLITGEELSLMSLMGFLMLAGVIVNNGIVFVDYANKLRMGGLDRRAALVATGRTRMRPILMTALTTVFAMLTMALGLDMGSQFGRGMAIVVIGGLLYATLMTLFIVPVLYDILYKKQPNVVDVGSDDMNDVPDDAAEFMEQFKDRDWFNESPKRVR